MSKHGDQTPPKGPDQYQPDPDFDQTLPEGAFDKTLPEGWAEPEPAGDGSTVVGDEPARADEGVTMLGDEPAHADEGATMLGDEPAQADENATMVGFGADATGQNSGDIDVDKTLPDGVLATLADDDYSMKTIMMDDIVTSEENEPPEEDFGKTLPDGAFDQMAGDDFAEKTMMLDSSGAGAEGEPFDDDGTKTLPEGSFGSPNFAGTTMLEDGSGPAKQDDGFGKTLQADAFGKTLATDGTIAPEPQFDGKTMVGPDSAVEGEIHANSQTVADAKLRRPGDSVARSHATHTGGKTSIDGTNVVGSEAVDGIDKNSLNVAMRSISGLQYGANARVDFKLVKQLGEGGMGVVYVARQQSLGREVVFKTLKPMAEAQASKMKASGTMNSVIKHRTDMFLSEAVVTADLFHPNIVPIYELAKAPDGSLFYTMKWVRGDGWNKRLKEMTLEENLEVLMKVSDAMGFAHSRHIVNRDLKPENVMLGGYGETIVLDWGLALPFGEGKGRLPIATTAGLGSGTPAYMPPELITGPLAKIGPACDIYLLGAMLFEVVTGLPPHDFSSRQSGGTMSAGAKLAEVRRVVVDNIIRETEKTGELIDIARKAMATKPEDRYRTVVDFQNAIRDYMKHAASHTLADRAKEMTVVAAPITTEAKPAAEAPSVGYTNYQNAVALYNESLREWSGNDVARNGLTETQKNFAELALVKGDFDLGLAVLDPKAESHSETRSKLLLARQEREGRGRLMKLLKIAASVLFGAVFLLFAYSSKLQLNLSAALLAEKNAKKSEENAKEETDKAQKATVKAQEDQQNADEQRIAANEKTKEALKEQAKATLEKTAAEMDRELAKKETTKAKEETTIAQTATMKADEARVAANKAKMEAEKAALVAEKQKLQAEEDKKNAEIAKNKADYKALLADASRSFFEGSYGDTRKKLNSLKKDYADLCDVEWEQLMNAASAPDTVSLPKPVESISLSRDGRKVVTGDSAGHIVVWPIDAKGNILNDKPIHTLDLGSRLHAVAMSPDGNDIAAAGKDGLIRVWSLTAVAEEPRIVLKGHEEAVNTLKFSDDGKRLASGGDDRIVRLWSLEKGREDEKRQLAFSKKVLYAVQCVDWSRDGQWLVAGTSSAPGNVNGAAYSWEVRAGENETTLIPIRQFQVVPGPAEKVKQNRGVVAIALTDDGKFAVSNGPAAEMYVWQVNPPVKERPNSTKESQNEIPLKINQLAARRLGDKNHSNRLEKVRSVAFSADSLRLFAAGDDGTISIWDRETGDGLPNYKRRLQVIYGHGGPVRGCLPLPQSPDLIISGSYDQNVHRLDLKTYFKAREPYDNPKKPQIPAAFQPADSDVSVLDTPYQSDSSSCGSESPTEPEPGVLAPPLVRSEYVLANFPQSEQKNSKSSSESEGSSDSTAGPRKSVRIAAAINNNKERAGHTDSVLSAVFSRDGTRVISASRDQTARTWNSETGLPVNTVTGRPAVFDGNRFQEGHEYDLFVMRFFPDGNRLLTSGFDGEMRIWDSQINAANQNNAAESFGRELATLPYTSMYGVVDISRDGKWILTAGRERTSRREDASGRDEVVEEEKKYEAQAQLWNTENVLASRRPTPELKLEKVHRFRVTTVAILPPDNSRLLTGDREGRIVLWDAKTGKVVGRPRNVHRGEVVKSEFLGNDGSRLLTAGVDRRVVLWKVVKTDSEFVFEKIRQFDQDGMVVNLAVSPLGDRFISVVRLGEKQAKNNKSKDSSTKVSLWDIETGAERVIDIPSRNPLRNATMSKQDRDRERERDRPPFPAWAANGTLAIITTAEGITVKGLTKSEGTIHFYDSVKADITQSLRVDNSEGDNNDGADYRAEPYAAVLRPDELGEPKHLLTQTHTAAYLWRLQGGQNLVSFRPQGPVFSAGYSSDGRFVVTGGRSLRIFDADESEITYGRLLHKIEYPHDGGVVTSVEFTPAENSLRFLSTSYDGTAKIWEWHPPVPKNLKATGVARWVATLSDHKGPVRFGTWSADGLRVLTVGEDARPRVWDFPPNQKPESTVLEIPLNDRKFHQLCGAFSWDGQFVAVGGRDAETDESIGWVWNLKPVGAITPQLYATIRGHGLGGINSVAFLPDDKRLLTGGTDGTARLWDWQMSAVAANNGKVIEADFLISLVRKTKKNEARFNLTDKSLASLRADEVPEALLLKLITLKDMEFETQQLFLEELRKKLSEDELEKFVDRILNQAKKDNDEQVTTTHRGPVTSVRVTRSGNIVTASADGTVLIWPK